MESRKICMFFELLHQISILGELIGHKCIYNFCFGYLSVQLRWEFLVNVIFATVQTYN